MSGESKKISGDLSYGRSVVVSIITLAAKEITGVHSLTANGVRASISGNNINVQIFANIMHGYTVSDVAFRIQENIKRSVETMTAYRVTDCSVTVSGVRTVDRA